MSSKSIINILNPKVDSDLMMAENRSNSDQFHDFFPIGLIFELWQMIMNELVLKQDHTSPGLSSRVAGRTATK